MGKMNYKSFVGTGLVPVRKGLHYFPVGAGKFIFAHTTYTHLLCPEAPDSRKGCPYGLHKADVGRTRLVSEPSKSRYSQRVGTRTKKRRENPSLFAFLIYFFPLIASQ